MLQLLIVKEKYSSVEQGKRLRDLRKGRGWSQEELAKRAGLSRSALPKLETGRFKDTRHDTIEKLAKAFDMTATEFISHIKGAVESQPETPDQILERRGYLLR